jgi:hypothetical protein
VRESGWLAIEDVMGVYAYGNPAPCMLEEVWSWRDGGRNETLNYLLPSNPNPSF